MMTSSTRHHGVSELRAWPQAAPVLWARAFGRAEDLDVDFGTQRPQLVTQILARCLRDAAGRAWSEEALWQWTVMLRTQALLAVAQAGALASVAAVARCARPECQEQIELELELDSFAREAGDGQCVWSGDAARVTLRLPTGADQRRWLEAPGGDTEDLTLRMGASLVRDIDGRAPEAAWRLPRAWLPGVEHALAERDPTTALSVSVGCSACGDAFEVEIDLEALLLERFARLQRELLLDVHCLASGYHWSEAEILALPAWRRAHYLGALRGEA
jgi:hypothetical protein